MGIENIKALVASLREYNEMSPLSCAQLVDELLDEHCMNDNGCKGFLINRIVIQLEHELEKAGK